MPIDHGQNAIAASIQDIVAGQGADLSYVLTAKQRSVLDSRFSTNLWPRPNCGYILVNLETVSHTIAARKSKDKMTEPAIVKMLASIFHKDSQINVSISYFHQFHLINSREKHADGMLAVGCFQVEFGQASRNTIRLETAYLATPAKVRKILGMG